MYTNNHRDLLRWMKVKGIGGV